MTMLENSIKKYITDNGLGTFCPKAVLFDMDGVLYNSMPNHAVAWQQAMAQFNINMTAADAYATEGARGVDTIRTIVKQQQNRDIDEAEAQRMYDVKTSIFHSMPTAPVFDGVIAIMRKIKDCGMAIGVVTGSGQKPLIARLVNDFGNFIKEESIVTAYDVKNGKPAPDPYLMGMKKVGGLKPCETIVVENAPLGVKAGVSAGCFTIAVNSGPLPDEALANEGANIVFGTMTELCAAWDDVFNA